MSEIRSRDELILTVNRLMICAMEDIDCGRNEASPTTLDLVRRIEDNDAALRLALETATQRIALDNAVCLCGCPLSEHEAVDEGAEQCEHGDHVCLRTCPAISQVHVAALSRLARAEEALREAERFVTHYMGMPLGTRIADRKSLLAELRAALAPGEKEENRG